MFQKLNNEGVYIMQGVWWDELKVGKSFSLGQPYLWARLDRKPNKQAEKRFKKCQHAHRSYKGILCFCYQSTCNYECG